MPQIKPNDELSSLRTEIVESEKARIDLLKYKVLAVAALGGVGLGVGAKGNHTSNILNSIIGDPSIVLCLIPFVCIFIDLLCFHNNLRILVIGRFLDNSGDPYEKFISNLGKYWKCHPKQAAFYFELEDWSLQWSSVMLSAIIAILGLFLIIGNNRVGWIFIPIGILGIIFSIIIWQKYKRRKNILFESANQLRMNDLGE